MATLSLEQVTKVFANGVEAVRQLDLFVDEASSSSSSARRAAARRRRSGWSPASRT